MKSQDGGHSGHFPASANARALKISAWLTGVYFFIELAIGFYTGSIAVISDAFHTFSAVGGVLLAFIAARIIGLDPDSVVLAIAKRKAAEAGADIEFVEAMGDAPPEIVTRAGIAKITSSLVLHQVPLDGKRAIIRKAYELLPPGGRLHIADFGEQRTWAMRFLFGVVQRLDGAAYTQPNADGVLLEIMRDSGFSPVEETNVIPTFVGSISLYRAIK